jgi:large subunit ribosomal protein L15
MKLHQLSDNPGARKKRIRVGRGIGSTKGKTAGVGGKGQHGRSGVAINGFEGGQMPLYRRLPKRGFNNIFRLDFSVVNVGALQDAIDAKRLDASKPINGKALKAAGLIGRVRDGVRLLAKGELKTKVNITVVGASKAAVAAVEKAGGSVTIKAPKQPKEAAAQA